MQVLKSLLGVMVSVCMTVSPVWANEVPVGWYERELVLVSDASASMYASDTQHWLIQKQGYMKALQDEEVIAALLSSPTAVRVTFFGGTHDSSYDIGPVFIDGREAVDRLVIMIHERTPTKSVNPSTSQCLGLRGAVVTERVGVRRIYDVVTDEPLQDLGRMACAEARKIIESFGDEVNVLGIAGAGKSHNRVQFQAHMVSISPRGFFMEVESWQDFAEAIKFKLLIELSM